MNIGLGMQIFALLMLAVPSTWLTIPWVMAAQALSGIAKDLNKMSAKSAIKTLVPDEQQGALYKWVAILTGSKNALKGAGFFIGGLLLSVLGFQYAVAAMAAVLTLVFIGSVISLESDMARQKLSLSLIRSSRNQRASISYPLRVCSCLALVMFGLSSLCQFILVPSLVGIIP